MLLQLMALCTILQLNGEDSGMNRQKTQSCICGFILHVAVQTTSPKSSSLLHGHYQTNAKSGSICKKPCDQMVVTLLWLDSTCTCSQIRRWWTEEICNNIEDIQIFTFVGKIWWVITRVVWQSRDMNYCTVDNEDTFKIYNNMPRIMSFKSFDVFQAQQRYFALLVLLLRVECNF